MADAVKKYNGGFGGYFERVKECPVCPGALSKLVKKTKAKFGPVVDIMMCQNCSLLYLNPMISQKSSKSFYQDDEYRELLKQKSEKRVISEIWDTELLIAEHKLLPFCGDYIKSGHSVLDVGAGAGGVLAYLRDKQKCDGVGIEPSKMLVDFARSKGLKMHQGTLDGLDVEPASFDFCLLITVLEHLNKPLETLRKIHRFLKKDGYIFVEVPDFIDRLRILPFQDGVTIYHPYMFGNESLTHILEMAGFEVIKIEDDFHPKRNWKGLKVPHTHLRVLAVARNGSFRSSLRAGIAEKVSQEIRKNQWRSIIFDLKSFSLHLWLRVVGRFVRFIFGERVYYKLKRIRKFIIKK